MTVPTTCTKCGEPLTFPMARDVRAAAKELEELDEATLRGEEPGVRAIVAVGMAMGLLKMCAGCIDGVCVLCQPISEASGPSLMQAMGIEPQWTGAR